MMGAKHSILDDDDALHMDDCGISAYSSGGHVIAGVNLHRHIPGTTLPEGGWMQPCLACNTVTSQSVQINDTQDLFVCKRCLVNGRGRLCCQTDLEVAAFEELCNKICQNKGQSSKSKVTAPVTSSSSAADPYLEKFRGLGAQKLSKESESGDDDSVKLNRVGRQESPVGICEAARVWDKLRTRQGAHERASVRDTEQEKMQDDRPTFGAVQKHTQSMPDAVWENFPIWTTP